MNTTTTRRPSIVKIAVLLLLALGMMGFIGSMVGPQPASVFDWGTVPMTKWAQDCQGRGLSIYEDTDGTLVCR